MQKTGIRRVSRGGSIADGIYSATSSSFNKDGETYKATVTVTVSGGKITALTATGPTKSSDNQEYFAEAFSGIKSRLVGTTASKNSGSTVDTVSGATKSSNLIKEAIDLALAGASSGGSDAPVNYTVTFSTNGHGTAPAAQTVASGERVSEPSADPTTEGYVFGGWYTDQGCTRACRHVPLARQRQPGARNAEEHVLGRRGREQVLFKAVLWAPETGVTTGYDDGSFRPNGDCTRAQVVTFLYRAIAE